MKALAKAWVRAKPSVKFRTRALASHLGTSHPHGPRGISAESWFHGICFFINSLNRHVLNTYYISGAVWSLLVQQRMKEPQYRCFFVVCFCYWESNSGLSAYNTFTFNELDFPRVAEIAS